MTPERRRVNRIPIGVFIIMGLVMLAAMLLAVDKSVGADYVRVVCLALAATVAFQVTYIGIAHSGDNNKRFPNWAVWGMGLSYVTMMIGPIYYLVDRIGQELHFFPTLPFGVSLLLSEAWLYALYRRY